jgi:hypothetical protein
VAGLALAVTGLGAVIAIASRGSWREGKGSPGFSVSTTAIGAILLAGAVVVAALAVAAGRMIWADRGGVAYKPKPWWVLLIRIVTLLAVLVALGTALPNLHGKRDGDIPSSGKPPTYRPSPESGTHSGTAATVVAALAAGALVLMLVAARRPKSDDELAPPAPDTDEAEAAGQAVALALADARLETDPRRAVLAAYAGMEQRLAEVGLARRPSEAPLEYLARVLDHLQVSGEAAHRLTELFERAGFGTSSVTPQVRDEALAALEAVGDELRVREPR